MRAQLDASRRLWALVGLGAFMAAFIAALGPLDVVFEFLDGGDIDVGIGQGMVVLAGSAIVLWLALAVMVRTGLARPGSLPWPLPGFLQEAGWQPGARSAAGALKQWQRAGFRLLSSILGPGANREARAHPGEIAFFRPVVDFQPTGQGAELRPYRPDAALVGDISLPTEGPLTLGLGPTALVDAINDWLEDPANRSKQLP